MARTAAGDTLRAERTLYWLVALVAVMAHWIPVYPPQVDLPQHAGQLRFLHDWTRGDFPYRDILQLHWFTPYLPAYLVGVGLMSVMSAVLAVKTLWSLAAVATLVSAGRVRRRLGGDAFWDWLLLPGLFGMTFQWGFLPYFFAVPFGLATFEVWLVCREAPTPRRGAALAVALAALFFAHSLVTAWLIAVCGMMLLADVSEGRVSWRTAIRRGLPLLAPLPVAGLWYLRTRGVAQTRGPTVWDGYNRVFDFFPQWLGMPHGTLTTLLGVLLLATPFVAGARIDGGAARRAPLVVTLAILFAGPNLIYGNAYTYNRFFTLLGPVLVFALATAPIRVGARRWLRVLLPLTSAACVGIIVSHLVAFAAEQRDFQRIIDRMAPRQPAVSLVEEASSAALRFDFTYLHFPVWYQADRGGLVQPSFAAYLPTIVHFRAGYVPSIPFGFEGAPRLQWERHRGRDFTYFVVRSADTTPPLSGLPVTLAAHEGTWWLFERRPDGR